MKKITALVLAMVMMFAMFAGCAKTDSPDTPVDPSKPNTGDPVLDTKQYMNSYITAEPQTLDISLGSDTYGSTIMNNTVEALTRLGEKDGEYEVQPAGAKEWTTSADGLVWTFKLNANKWLDGTPVTAKDYVYAYQRHSNPETGSQLGYFLEPLKNFVAISKGEAKVEDLGVKAIDDLTLEITLENPTPHFLALTYQRMLAPMNQAMVEKHGEAYGSEAAKVESNGPYYVKTWTHNSEVILGKNENYWNKDAIKLEEVKFSIIGDDNTYYNAFFSGELDMVTTGKKDWLDKFSTMKDVKQYNYTLATTSFSFFNQNDKIFSNQKIRMAFMLGLDREEMNEVVYTGLREPAYGWVSSAMAVGDNNFRKAAGDPIKELAKQHSDPKALLLEGMKELGLGTDPATLDITFSLGGTDQWYTTMGDYLQQCFKETLGVDVKIEKSEWTVFSANVSRGDYQMGLMGWGAFFNDPIDVLGIFKSSAKSVNTGWNSPEFDALIDSAAKELDEAKRTELYIQAENLLLSEAVISPTAYSKTYGFRKNCIYGLNELALSNAGFYAGYTSGR